ncbi:hypothetical protein BDV59DRAFT_185539 [Aspergillus ambiguus]|uniref:uncharacterized protein n=1 Tax=Aspergillus ambiguus TaxID=176160 RepID=UPI003CCCB3C6
MTHFSSIAVYIYSHLTLLSISSYLIHLKLIYSPLFHQYIGSSLIYLSIFIYILFSIIPHYPILDLLNILQYIIHLVMIVQQKPFSQDGSF